MTIYFGKGVYRETPYDKSCNGFNVIPPSEPSLPTHPTLPTPPTVTTTPTDPSVEIVEKCYTEVIVV